jgi:hypothetical protein
MYARTDKGKSVGDLRLQGAKLTRIDSCTNRDHTGRYNLTTTAQNFIAAVEWIDTELPEIIAAIPEGERGEFEGCVERVSPGASLSHSTTTNNSRKSTTSYLSALTLGFESDNSDDAAPPTIRRKSRYKNPMIEFDFDDDLVFPALPIVAAKPRPPQLYRSPTPSTKSASSSITMSEINAVRSEIQAKFETDMIQFKKEISDRLESEIATAVKNSVATALEGINATMNQILSANNTIVYDNIKSKREIITNATAVAVAKKVDIAVSAAVARALATHAKSSAASPARTKRSSTNDDAVMENSAFES